MACDFTIAVDTASFGQAGPKHGSAPDGGSTDFLDLFVGIGNSIESCTLCEHWSAHRSMKLGLINKLVPGLKKSSGEFIPNPFVELTEYDSFGNPVFGDFKTGDAKNDAKKIASECETDLSLLDKEVEKMAYSLALTMPGCLSKTLESCRKQKMSHWLSNCETNRSWLGLNMMTEGKAGFRAFNEGPKNNREADFILLRKRLSEAAPWTEELVEEILPK